MNITNGQKYIIIIIIIIIINIIIIIDLKGLFKILKCNIPARRLFSGRPKRRLKYARSPTTICKSDNSNNNNNNYYYYYYYYYY